MANSPADNTVSGESLVERAMVDKSPGWMIGLVGIFRTILKDSVYAILACSALITQYIRSDTDLKAMNKQFQEQISDVTDKLDIIEANEKKIGTVITNTNKKVEDTQKTVHVGLSDSDLKIAKLERKIKEREDDEHSRIVGGSKVLH